MADTTRYQHDIGTVYACFDTEQGEGAICEILLMNPDGCVVSASYMERDPKTSLAMDITGAGLWLVPWDEITSIIDEVMAETIIGCMDADARLLSYAR